MNLKCENCGEIYITPLKSRHLHELKDCKCSKCGKGKLKYTMEGLSSEIKDELIAEWFGKISEALQSIVI